MFTKITKFFLASMLALAVIGGDQLVQGTNGAGVAYAKTPCVKINGKKVCVKGKYVGKRTKYGSKYGYRGRGHGWGHHRSSGVDSFVGGVVGGVVGNAIGNLFFSRPDVVVVDRGPSVVEPWSGEWYRVCADTFQSFNPRTGYYVGYDGVARFCTIKR